MEKVDSLSVIILAKNESELLPDVLQHFSWAGEIIVIDNGSTDDTVTKAKLDGASVISVPDNDFSLLRNIGAQKARGPWLLYIDTDEEVSQELKNEILSIINTDENNEGPGGYVLERNNYYFGTKWPVIDGMVRLIYKPKLKKWFGKIHETASIDGLISTLHNRVTHRTHSTFEDMVEKTNDWSEIEAGLRLDANHPSIVPWRILRVMITGFTNSYIRQRGFKVGTIGLLESVYQSFSYAVTYLKLWEMQEKLR